MTARIVLFTILFAATASGTQAAINSGGGPRGAGFTCDVNTRECTCTGTWEGADCQGMKKNCQGSIYKICLEKPEAFCTCTMAITRRPPSARSPLTSPLTR
jgi:hypothetical protein